MWMGASYEELRYHCEQRPQWTSDAERRRVLASTPGQERIQGGDFLAYAEYVYMYVYLNMFDGYMVSMSQDTMPFKGEF